MREKIHIYLYKDIWRCGMAFPDWVEKQKRTGHEIKCIRGQYYMYKLKSKWDTQRKKAKKVSGEYIGKVTPNGLMPKKKHLNIAAPVYALEYGASAFILSLAEDVLNSLKQHFEARTAERVFTTAMLRLISPSPFCRAGEHYETSWMSKALPHLALSPASVTKLLNTVGKDRVACTAFMRETMGASPYYLIDGTRTVSASDYIFRAAPGHSKTKSFLPQINQVYIMALSESGGTPVFYRNVAGNIPDVSALELTVKDALIAGATFIGDTGFASNDNFTLLVESGLDYIVPLKRNTSEVSLSDIAFEDVFSYHHRTIWAHSEDRDGYRICVFRDERLKNNEMTDFVERAEKANAATKAKRSFDPNRDALRDVSSETIKKAQEFGIIVIRASHMDVPPQKIYEVYKLRWEIEQMFDTMRNVCENDASYMHDDIGFEAWSFIGHITLMVACRILALLKKKELSKQWSLTGILDHLSHIYAVQIADGWRIAETTKKTRELTTKLNFDLPTSDQPVLSP
jgi:transposase